MVDNKKDFDLQKKLCLDKLYKADKSRKGDVDKAIIPLIEHINSLDDYYHVSSTNRNDLLWLLAITILSKSSMYAEMPPYRSNRR